MSADSRKVIEDVRKVLVATSKSLRRRCVWGCREWTQAILERLGNLGEESGFSVLPKVEKSQRKASEWLYDLIWYTEDETDLTSVELALESEWSWKPWDVRYDFQKLLVAKAAVKVLIAEGHKEEEVKVWVNNIKSFTPRDSSSLYLFALYHPEGFEFQVYNGNGDRQPEIIQ